MPGHDVGRGQKLRQRVCPAMAHRLFMPRRLMGIKAQDAKAPWPQPVDNGGADAPDIVFLAAPNQAPDQAPIRPPIRPTRARTQAAARGGWSYWPGFPDSITCKLVAEPSLQVAAVRAGPADVACNASRQEFETLTAAGFVTATPRYLGFVNGWAINVQAAPFDDLRARQVALNRQEIIDTV